MCYDGILYIVIRTLRAQAWNNSDAFFLGYGFALLHVVFQSRIVRFCNVLKVDFVLFVGRSLIVTNLHYMDLKCFGFAIQALMNIALLYNLYSLQKGEENLIQNIFQIKEQLAKTREKVFNHIPDGILVLAVKTQKALFSNRTFDKMTSNVLRLAEDFKQDVFKLVPGCLEKILLQNNSFTRKSLQDFFVKRSMMSSQKPISLSHVISELIKYQLVKDDPVQFRAYYVDTLGQKKLYEVKTMRTSWNSEESFVIIFDDITDQEAAVYLRMTDANKDKIISTVSHEFRTPLNGILGILQIMEKSPLDSEHSRYVSLCKSNASLLLSVANTMLDIQQIREGKFKLHPGRFNLMTMLEEIKSLFEFQCNAKDLTLEIMIGADVPKYITTDVNRLKQVLINLINNALKFTFEGGITVALDQDQENEHSLKFSVIDTGLGIAEEDQQKLFKMFGKLEKTENINKGGTGLGLMISDTLARLLNVTKDEKGIKVESQIGKGSRFFFVISKTLRRSSYDPGMENSLDSEQHVSSESLRSVEEKMNTHNMSRRRSSFVPSIKYNIIPELENTIFDSPKKLLSVSNNYLDADHTTINSKIDLKSHSRMSMSGHYGQAHSKRSSLFKPKTETNSPCTTFPLALIVDDNPFNIMVAEKMVQASGFRVMSAFNGKAAIEVVKKQAALGQPFKLILMDCEMPIMDGFETTRVLLKSMRCNELPYTTIVALTAHEKAEEKKRCLEVGMADVLVKPINDKKLNKLLEKYK